MTALEAIAVASNHTNHILQFEIFSWSCHTYHVTETKKSNTRHLPPKTQNRADAQAKKLFFS